MKSLFFRLKTFPIVHEHTWREFKLLGAKVQNLKNGLAGKLPKKEGPERCVVDRDIFEKSHTVGRAIEYLLSMEMGYGSF